jgi:DNA-directed RNA polymerase subunit alpha
MAMLQIQCLESKVQDNNVLFSRFIIDSLHKGQGLTIGNALRRVLLSDLQGLAVTGVRIDDVNHEFSMISGVKEDVVDILLNIKQIILKGNVTDPCLLRLNYRGPGIITTKDINLPSGITLINPNQYIATVNSNKPLVMEFVVQKGEGYSISTKHSVPKGFLSIDAVYMPVKKVNFFVETGRDNVSTNLESLILEIYTNGSIEPLEALECAATHLQQIFNSFKTKNISDQLAVTVEDKKNDSMEPCSKFDNIMIEELELSVRAYNCLKRAQIHTLSDLLTYSQEELLEFKNFGQKSATEVYLSLKTRFGQTLK